MTIVVLYNGWQMATFRNYVNEVLSDVRAEVSQQTQLLSAPYFSNGGAGGVQRRPARARTRVRRRPVLASWPKEYIPEGFPKDSVKKGFIASKTSGLIGVVAA